MLEHVRPAAHAAQSVRYLNELRALDVLFREGAMSRADLARALGLNRSTTGSIVNALLIKSLVVEQPGEKELGPRAQTGRPGIDVALDPGGAIFIGAGIEVERMTVVAVNLSGELIKQASVDFPAGVRLAEDSAAKIADMVKTLTRAIDEPERVQGLCVAVPALVEAGVARLGLLLNWRDVPIADLISKRLSRPLPVSIENEANAFAIAETYRGNARNLGTIAFVVIESGAGCGIVADGRLFRGSNGMAGEFGHLELGGPGYVSGGAGMLESYVGREAALARFRHHGGSRKAGFDQFMEALRRGEPPATKTAKDWAKWLGRGLSHLINLLNPGLIIIAGSVGGIYPYVASEVQAALRSALRSVHQMPRIEMSELGDEGSALGAALILHQRMFSVDERVVFPRGETRGLIRMASV